MIHMGEVGRKRRERGNRPGQRQGTFPQGFQKVESESSRELTFGKSFKKTPGEHYVYLIRYEVS